MDLKHTRNLKRFKKEIGQTNHFLITIIVGLTEIKKNQSIKIDEEIHAAWNPCDRTVSANRSIVFARKAALTWAVDNLDMYLRICNREPSVLFNSALIQKMNSQDTRGITSRFKAYCELLDVKSTAINLVYLAIAWRNRLVHSFAQNDITPQIKRDLLNDSVRISDEYRGLDITRTIEAFERSETLSLKTTTSFIQALINAVYAIDSKVVITMDQKLYIMRILDHELFSRPGVCRAKYFNSDRLDRKRIIKNILHQHGFSINTESSLLDSYIEDIVHSNKSPAT